MFTRLPVLVWNSTKKRKGDGTVSHTDCDKDHQLGLDLTVRQRSRAPTPAAGCRPLQPRGSGRAPLLPELHAGAPRAGVLPQEQVVEGHGVDHVEELLEHLQDDLRVQALVAHDRVEGIHLADDGFQAVGVVPVYHAGGALPVARWLHAR